MRKFKSKGEKPIMWIGSSKYFHELKYFGPFFILF